MFYPNSREYDNHKKEIYEMFSKWFETPVYKTFHNSVTIPSPLSQKPKTIYKLDSKNSISKYLPADIDFNKYEVRVAKAPGALKDSIELRVGAKPYSAYLNFQYVDFIDDRQELVDQEIFLTVSSKADLTSEDIKVKYVDGLIYILIPLKQEKDNVKTIKVV